MSMTNRQRMVAALEGGIPDITPFTIYSGFVDDRTSDSWKPLIDDGLGLTEHCMTVQLIEHGVETSVENVQDNGHNYRIETKYTPVGSIRQVHTDGWHTESWIKEPNDYRIMQWIVEHTEIVSHYESYQMADDLVGEHGVPVILGSRSPAMSINIDLAGTEQFCIDLALELPELFDLYAAKRKLFMEEVKMIAAGPGHYVKWFENLTISMIGAKRYGELLMPVYEEAVPILEAGGKRLMVHYDGDLQIISDQIVKAPFHMIESLTEPPEGNMTYDQCRNAWPDKVFWGNINLECYDFLDAELRDSVIAKRERAGKAGLLFEISETLPANWQRAIPVILGTLEELG